MRETKPLAYGYTRISCDASDEQLCDMEQSITRFADEHGLEFAAFFFEHVDGSQEAFNELCDELRRADAHNVIVPSAHHFSLNAVLQGLMFAQLEMCAMTDVHELADC